jgi:hypothetical protein
MKWNLIWVGVLMGAVSAFSSHAQNAETDVAISESDMPFLLNYSNLKNPFGRVILSNDYVVAQRLVVPGRTWEGVHSHPGNQLYVHIKGGFWSGRMGERLMYYNEYDPAGAMGRMDHIPFSDGHDSRNTGDEPIDLIYITRKTGEPLTADEEKPTVLPNLTFSHTFETELMIAQRVQIKPGEWSGVHDRPGNQMYLLVQGGTLSERIGGGEAKVSPLNEDGEPLWLDAAKGYEFGNTGDTIIDLVLVTFK